MIVLALNSGSSSLKFGVYRVNSSREEPLLTGEAHAIGAAHGEFSLLDARDSTTSREPRVFADQSTALAHIISVLAASNLPALTAVGHRVVHGGAALREHCLIDETVVHQLDAAAVFAPIHTPAALSVIQLAIERFPGLPQVACLDTAFHADMPDVASTFPIAASLRAHGMKRYGFHGLSCESIVRQLAHEAPDRVVIAHLGNGASVTAVKRGKSIDTSMGLTPTGGVMMSTRSGDIDPGLLIYLLLQKEFRAVQLEHILNNESGLLGISGLSGDMRHLHDVAASNATAQLAVDMFCYAVRKQIAAMIAALNGIDRLVFTGGIGENDALVRATICSGLACMGIHLSDNSNRSKRDAIQAVDLQCLVEVLPAAEEQQIAHHTWNLCSSK
jgi:acetate kinase